MWEKVTPADIDEAKRAIKVRCEAMLLRQANELRDLEAQEVEVQALRRLVEDFVQRYGVATAVPNAIIA